MINEKLLDVLEVRDPQNWPKHYVVTDCGGYEYTGQSFEKGDLPNTGISIDLPANLIGRLIGDVRGDGESAAIQLDNGDLIVFELTHNPFGPMVESRPSVRFISVTEALTWQNEYNSMERLR